MAGNVRTYDPKLVTVMFGGMAVTGFAEDSVVNCERNEDKNLPHVGVLGEVSRAINADDTGTITIHLAGTSPWISRFAQLAQENELQPCTVVDLNDGGVNVGGSESWIVKAPDVVLGQEIDDQEIEIFIADYTVR